MSCFRRWVPVLAIVLGLMMAEPVQAQNNVYLTAVAEHDDDIFELANGAIFEKTAYGYTGYLGYRTEALLFSTGRGERLWVNGQGLIEGRLLRAPDGGPNARASLVWVDRVRGGGEFLELDTGELLEVDPVDTVESMIWVAPFEAILLDDGRLLNLDEPSSEMVMIVNIR